MEKLLEIPTASRLSSVGEYYFSKKLREIEELKHKGRDIISLGVGSPDRPPHNSVIETLNEYSNCDNTHGYQPYVGKLELRQAFAQWYTKYYHVNVDSTNILPLIGSKEGIMHIAMTYLESGDQVLIPNPGYPTYRSAFTLSGAECVEYKLTAQNGWQIDIDRLEKMDLSRVKILMLNYPHMPTGTEAAEGLFEQLIAFGRKHNILLVNDNPYSFIRTSQPKSLLSVDGALSVAIELNSLSKSHNMAGWRVGAIIGHSQRLSEIIRFKSNMDSGTFLPMQMASIKALELNNDWYNELNAIYKEREALGNQIMEELGCKAKPNQAGLFIWGEIPKNSDDCYSFTDNILDKYDIFITPGGIFGSEGDQFVRISLCATKETLTKVLARLKSKK